MDPLTKGPCGSQMAQTILWKAKSSLSFGIQPLQTWPTKDPELESQVNLLFPVMLMEPSKGLEDSEWKMALQMRMQLPCLVLGEEQTCT
ncbi:GARNL3 isoform 15 [Pongo abelii]|uniref:GARNL3 isoform 15 n=1 Tax=Pongo abelii TaxID=9601 RepID=A0A2J8UKH5_PONAB|nr:GARNL3 isoform 15 [Pongo abelii]